MTKDYAKSCQSPFWKEVFEKELDYLKKELKGYQKILSIGCGPAIIEKGLQEAGFDVTGLDVSKEALEGTPDNIRTVIGSAEQMNIPDQSFDAAIYVASLQFIEDYSSAVRETARVLRQDGKLVVMLLNPESEFFKNRIQNASSYLNKIKHIDLKSIEIIIEQYFSSRSEYYLGIQGTSMFDSRDPSLASLYVIEGVRK